MALVNPIAAGYRQVVRVTEGKRLQAKQDRAANIERVNQVLQMRPRNFAPLSVSDYRTLAARYQAPPVRLVVLSEKESGIEGGFQRDGRLTIMNEPAKFSKYTGRAYDLPTIDPVTFEKLPALSYPNFVKSRDWKKLPKAWLDGWKQHPYQFAHRDRWQLWTMWAMQNFDAAVMSISIGRFQVMGFHWQAMGFKSPLEMLEFAYESEFNHLDLCLRWFVINDRMKDLRSGSWYAVAAYNGTGDRERYAAECAAIEKKRAAMFA